MNPLPVTAVIPTWNRADLLARLLPLLPAQGFARVLVVDNGSTDHSPEVAAQHGAELVSMGVNAGFAAAVNRGMAEVRTPWAVVLNNDVEPRPGWLAVLLTSSLRESAWFATGRLLQTNQPQQLDGTYDAVCRGACAVRMGHGMPDHPFWRTPRRIAFAPFTGVLLRTELFSRLGGLDERFESYLEDVDFGMRCAAQGYSGWYEPEAVALHQGSATLGRWHAETTRRIARNQLWLVAKHFPARLWQRWWWPVIVAQGLWGVVAIRHSSGWPYVKGKMQGVFSFQQIRCESQPAADGGNLLAQALLASEEEIWRSRQSGRLPAYWRWYFRLVGAPRTPGQQDQAACRMGP